MQKYYKKFYWIETPGNYEDWFVVSMDQYLAEQFFADNEGYDIEDLNSVEVCDTIYENCSDESYFPSFEMLVNNGFEFISDDEPMVVWKGGKKYCQGDIIHAINLQASVLKQGLYIIEIRNSDLYKIGVTKNIVQRMKQFETANPFEFYLHGFYQTEKCRDLESILHHQFKHKRFKREWFKLNEDELKNVSNIARQFIGLAPYIDGYISPLSKLDSGMRSFEIKNDDNDILPF